MQNKRQRFLAPKYTLLLLAVFPVIKSISRGFIGSAVLTVFFAFALICAAVRYKREKKNAAVYAIYICEFLGMLIYYLLYAVFYNRFVAAHEVHFLWMFLSLVLLLPLVFDQALQAAKSKS